MYFEYNYFAQTDDIALILFERFYLTPWIRRYVDTKPRYRLKECQTKLSKDLVAISDKLRKNDYEIKEEVYDLMDVFRDMDSKLIF